MMLSAMEVQCTDDFVVSSLNGEDFVALQSGNTYKAVETCDLITVDNGNQKLSFRKAEFPFSQLVVVH